MKLPINTTTVEQSEIEDQVIDTSVSLRDYPQARRRLALRSEIDEGVAKLYSSRH